ncbi:hypothetical protein, partial [Sphingopyxis sp.]|uniref:hypothetical protein n=1 Tax=Sphingopyxis sp. TaxID=1908224 RepID=UPI0025F5C7DA
MTDLDISFRSMVYLMVKAALAAIPAILILLFFFFGAGAFINALTNSFVAYKSLSAGDAEKKDADIKRHAAALAASGEIKKSIRTPDSIVFDTLLVSDDAKAVCVRFRARNDFGGMTRES